MGVGEWLVVGALFVCVASAPLVFFDALRLRMQGALVWPLIMPFVFPLAFPAYLHFRRIHMKRLRDLAAASGTTELPKAPLPELGRDLLFVLGGAMLVVLGVAFWLGEMRMRYVPQALIFVGVSLLGTALANLRRRTL